MEPRNFFAGCSPAERFRPANAGTTGNASIIANLYGRDCNKSVPAFPTASRLARIWQGGSVETQPPGRGNEIMRTKAIWIFGLLATGSNYTNVLKSLVGLPGHLSNFMLG